MKDQILRHARVLLSPLAFLLLFIGPVVKAEKNGECSAAFNQSKTLKPASPDQQLLVNLMVMLPGKVESLADGLRIRYNVGYQASTVDDILKMNNFAENISSYRENKELIVERRPLIGMQDTIYLRLTNTTPREYRLKMYTRDFGMNKIAYLEDAWLHKYQVIDLSGDTTKFDFTVTTDPASQASNRFRVVFFGVGTLPIHFTGISALAANDHIQVRWTAADDKEVTQYEIERSANGTDFTRVGTTYPGNSLYSWTDDHPLSGVNYYRIRSVSKGGSILYSTMVKASLKTDGNGMLVFPNPVVNHTLHISLTGMAADYSILLVNSQGQAVMQQPLKHSGGTLSYTIPVNTSIAPGRYSLQVLEPHGSLLQKNLVIL